MSKHRSNETSDKGDDYTGKHRALHTEDKTADIHVDRDDRGRVTGWAVGRDPGPDNYSR